MTLVLGRAPQAQPAVRRRYSIMATVDDRYVILDGDGRPVPTVARSAHRERRTVHSRAVSEHPAELSGHSVMVTPGRAHADAMRGDSSGPARRAATAPVPAAR